MEVSTVRNMFTDPKHPYAQALIRSLPNLDNKGVFNGIPGMAPALLQLPSGCAFHPRCSMAKEICTLKRPEPITLSGGQILECHLYTENA